MERKNMNGWNNTTKKKLKILSQNILKQEYEILIDFYIKMSGDTILKVIGAKSIYKYICSHDIDYENNIIDIIQKELSVEGLVGEGMNKIIIEYYFKNQIGAIEQLFNELYIYHKTDQNINIIYDIICKQYNLFLLFNKLSKSKNYNLNQVINEQVVQNNQELNTINYFLQSEGMLLSNHQIYNLQNTIRGIISSNNMIVNRDVNYKNSSDLKLGSHNSLFIPHQLDYKKIFSVIGDYTDFIEAVSCFSYKNFSTTYGFLHKVVIDDEGHAYQIEFPIMLIDTKIFDLKSKYIKKILDFEKKFLFNHDLWHHLIPVYAKHFILHHPDAPISFGGILESYKTFGQKIRSDKNDYEIGLGICQRLMIEEIDINTNNSITKQQYGLFEKYIQNLNALYDEQKGVIDNIDDIVEHLLINGISRFLTIYTFDKLLEFDYIHHNILTGLIKKIGDQGVLITTEEVKQLMIDLDIYNYQKNSIKSTISGNIINLITALQQMKLIKNDIPNTQYLEGLQKYRRFAIIYPEKKSLSGYIERIHHNEIYFGGVSMNPKKILLLQHQHFIEHYDEYNKRIYLRNQHQKIINKCYNFLIKKENIQKKIQLIDTVVMNILTHSYLPINEYSNNNYEDTDLKNIINNYNKIAKITLNHYDSEKICQSKGELLNQVMSL